MDYLKEEIKTKLEYLKIDVFFLFSLSTGSISLLLSENFESVLAKQLLSYFGFIGALSSLVYLVVLTKEIREHLDELKNFNHDTNNNN